jgi:hypothetical protein
VSATSAAVSSPSAFREPAICATSF